MCSFTQKGNHNQILRNMKKVDYDCNQCGGNFSNQNNFIFTRNPSMMDWDMTAINVMKVLDHMVNFRTIHKKTIRNCDQCDDTFKDKNTLNRNKHSKHEVWLSSMTGLLCMVYYKKYTHEYFDVTRNSNMMDWDTTVINVMEVLDHMVTFRTIHNKSIRNCDQCDKTFKERIHWWTQASKHEVVKYDCDWLVGWIYNL